MIFWKYLKGLNENSGENPQLFTYISFSNVAYVSNSKDKVYLPRIYINNQNSYDTSSNKDLGHIITSEASNQVIKKDFWFRPTDDPITSTSASASIYIKFLDDRTWIHHEKTSDDRKFIELFSDDRVLMASKTCVDLSLFKNNAWFNGLHITNSSLQIGNSTNNIDMDVYGYGHFSKECQASYFNATSDKRAKTDIKPLSINALELVDKTPLYSFKYKDSDLPSIGIIAQDVQDINIEGFKLVDNEQASGKDYDYMSIHESKLTYILWKAVQEQQALIKDLQAQINELKKN